MKVEGEYEQITRDWLHSTNHSTFQAPQVKSGTSIYIIGAPLHLQRTGLFGVGVATAGMAGVP